MKLKRSIIHALMASTLFIGAHVTFAVERPNVLFIMADDLNTALSGYGHPQCKTPNLDRLAQQGISFTRAYCQFPLCGPSRASLMSGRYPLANGVTRNGQHLGSEVPTLPQLFRESGYWTARVSKIYHMGVPGNIYTGDNGTDHPASWSDRYNVSVMESLTPGKAEDVMLVDSTPVYGKYREKWKQLKNTGGKLFIDHGNHQGSDFVIVEAAVDDAELADGAAANKAIELLKQRATTGIPFFLAVGFVRPHVPFVAPERSFADYPVDAMQTIEVPKDDLNDIPPAAKKNTNAARWKLSPEAQRKSLRGYYASVSYMDEQVGRLLDTVDELDLRQNTIIVFLSDHGYHLGEHTLWQKVSLFEESIRAPLIVSVPGKQTAGRKSAAIVEFVDLYPTLVELAGMEPPHAVQGQSFAHLLDNPDAPAREDALIQSGNSFCLRTPQYAYMLYPSEDHQSDAMLYDMSVDPRQINNLAGQKDHAEIEKRLHNRLIRRIDLAEGGDK